jgi:hypothetical protein
VRVAGALAVRALQPRALGDVLAVVTQVELAADACAHGMAVRVVDTVVAAVVAEGTNTAASTLPLVCFQTHTPNPRACAQASNHTPPS